MKAIITKEWNQLSPKSQAKILAAFEKVENKDMTIILDLLLKMHCCVLHDANGFTEEDLICYLGNYRQMFRRQAKKVREGKQIEEIDARMREIFPQNGYPDQFFRSMIADWDITT